MHIEQIFYLQQMLHLAHSISNRQEKEVSGHSHRKKKIICDTLIYISYQYFHRIKFTFLEIKYYSRGYQDIKPDFLTNILTSECPRFSTRYPKLYLPSHTVYTEILSYC